MLFDKWDFRLVRVGDVRSVFSDRLKTNHLDLLDFNICNRYLSETEESFIPWTYSFISKVNLELDIDVIMRNTWAGIKRVD
ncbi:MAG: hypothetical protein ACE5G1_15955 [bacterium]